MMTNFNIISPVDTVGYMAQYTKLLIAGLFVMYIVTTVQSDQKIIMVGNYKTHYSFSFLKQQTIYWLRGCTRCGGRNF